MNAHGICDWVNSSLAGINCFTYWDILASARTAQLCSEESDGVRSDSCKAAMDECCGILLPNSDNYLFSASFAYAPRFFETIFRPKLFNE